MALSPYQQKTRLIIKRANQRLRELKKHDIAVNQNAQRLLDMLQQPDFNLGRNATLAREATVRRAAEKFLGMKTSTVKGYKTAEKNRDYGFAEKMKSLGFSGDTLTRESLRGLGNLKRIAESLSRTSDILLIELAEGAEKGETPEQVIARIAAEKHYNDDLDFIDDVDF